MSNWDVSYEDDGQTYPPNGTAWDPWKSEFLRRNYNKLTDKRIAQRLGHLPCTIRRRAKILGLGPKPKIFVRKPSKRLFSKVELRKDLAYVLGGLLGDGCMSASGHIILVVKDIEFAQAFAECLGRLIGRTCHIGFEKHGYRVRYVVKPIRRWIKRHTIVDLWHVLEGAEGDFLAGFFDAEGCASIDKKMGKRKLCIRSRKLIIVNTNPMLILLVRRLLLDLGIEHKMHRRGWSLSSFGSKYASLGKPSYAIVIGRLSAMRVFHSKVYPRISRKRLILDEIVSSSVTANVS